MNERTNERQKEKKILIIMLKCDVCLCTSYKCTFAANDCVFYMVYSKPTPVCSVSYIRARSNISEAMKRAKAHDGVKNIEICTKK